MALLSCFFPSRVTRDDDGWQPGGQRGGPAVGSQTPSSGTAAAAVSATTSTPRAEAAAAQPPPPQPHSPRASSPAQASSRLAAAQPTKQEPQSAAKAPFATAAGGAPRLEPSSVMVCDPFELVQGLKLGRELGRGTYGCVLKGLWQGSAVAVKVLVTEKLDRTVLRETLVGPTLTHPHVVRTFFTRTAQMTHAFFDELETADLRHRTKAAAGGGMPEETTATTDDGMGNPDPEHDVGDPLPRLHAVLYSLKAKVEHLATVVVMEYCDKSTLAWVIKKNIFSGGPSYGERLARRALLRTASEVARGMQHLHEAGVVHGDLKPGNVLLCQSRSDRRGFIVKVADFGLAHCLQSGAAHTTDNSWGTIAYMPLEGFFGLVGFPTDVYAFGSILYEMLYREMPYQGMKCADVLEGRKAGTLRLNWRPVPLMADLVALGIRCTMDAPALRPSFQEVQKELVRIEQQLRVMQRPACAEPADPGAAAAAAAQQQEPQQTAEPEAA